MKVNRDTLEKLAHLCRLEIKPAEEEALLKSLNDIVAWVDKLETLDTDGVEPLTHMSENRQVFRQDGPAASLPRDKALENAPQHDGEFFKVPKVIE